MVNTDVRKVVKELRSRQGKLEEIRQPYEAMWDEIITFVQHYMRGVRSPGTKGKATGQMVYDGTPLSALNLLADGLHGYLVSPSMRWFSLCLPNTLMFPRWSGMRRWNGKRLDEYPDVKEYLEDYEDTLYSAFKRSNYYEITPSFFRTGGGVGTASLFREYDRAKARIVYQHPHPREVYVSRDKDGHVKGVHRKYMLTLDQLQEKFGKEQMGRTLRGFDKMYEQNRYTEKEVLHITGPREGRDPTMLNNENMPVESYWIMQGVPEDKALMLESGFQINPWTVWCWYMNSDEWYGRSPSWDAYVEIVKGNKQEKDILEAGDMALHPHVIASKDLRNKIDIRPKGHTYVENKNYVFETVQAWANTFPIGDNIRERNQKVIKEFYHVDFFLMLSQAAFNKLDITATQVVEMSEEKSAILGTRIGRLQSEHLNPEIDIVAAIEDEEGRTPEPPEILQEYSQMYYQRTRQNAKIMVEYQGPLATAQIRMFKTSSIRSALQDVAGIAQVSPNIAQEIEDTLDGEVTTRELWAAHGAPTKCLRSADVVAANRKARLQAQQQANSLEEAEKLGQAAKGLGRPVDATSPMKALMSGGAGE